MIRLKISEDCQMAEKIIIHNVIKQALDGYLPLLYNSILLCFLVALFYARSDFYPSFAPDVIVNETSVILNHYRLRLRWLG
ncbi:MAG: hypothetical protein WCG98_08085 [bacterium]